MQMSLNLEVALLKPANTAKLSFSAHMTWHEFGNVHFIMIIYAFKLLEPLHRSCNMLHTRYNSRSCCWVSLTVPALDCWLSCYHLPQHQDVLQQEEHSSIS